VRCANALEVAPTAESSSEEDVGSGESEEAGEANEGGEGEGGGSTERSETERPSTGAGVTSKGKKHSKAVSVVLSGLRLTRRSVLGLHQSQPTVSQIEFSFHLNRSAKVRVSLSLLAQAKHSHTHWAPLHESLSISTPSTTHRMWGSSTLAPGRYKLTAAPTHGRGDSVYLTVHS
jgi:hypothetical protein